MKLVADNDGPKPGDLDEHGVPFEEREWVDPYRHFDTPDGWVDPDDWQPPQDHNDLDPDGNVVELNHEHILETVDPSEWATVPTPKREWALNQWIPARQMTLFTGDGGAGKSLAGQQLVTCMAMGRPFLGVPTVMANSLYLTCEDDYDELHRRQKDICAGLNMSLEALAGRLELISLMGAIGNGLATFKDDGTMKTTPAWDRLLYTIRVKKIGFVVLDNVAHLFTGNENIRNQVAAFCGLLNKLASETGAAVVLIGHPNKMGGEYSGSTAWTNQVRSRLYMEVPTVLEDGKPVVIDPDARTISRAKANYAKKGELLEFRWHNWCFVAAQDLPEDEFEAATANAKDAADDALFMELFRERRGQHRPVSSQPRSADYAPRVFAEMKQGRKIGRRRFEAAMDRLFEAGKIEVGQVGQYSNRAPKMGIIEALQSAHNRTQHPRREAAHNVAHDPHTTANDTLGEKRTQPRAHNQLGTTSRNPGGASWPPAPGFEDGPPSPDDPRGMTDPWADDF